jgi:hypothetical protein
MALAMQSCCAGIEMIEPERSTSQDAVQLRTIGIDPSARRLHRETPESLPMFALAIAAAAHRFSHFRILGDRD